MKWIITITLLMLIIPIVDATISPTSASGRGISSHTVVTTGEVERSDYLMAWQIAYGIIILASVYVLLKIANLMKPDPQNPAQESLVNGLKIYLIIISLGIVFMAISSMPSIIDATISTDSSLSTSSDVDTVKEQTGIISKTYMFTLIPFVFFMLVLLLIFIFNYFTARGSKGGLV